MDMQKTGKHNNMDVALQPMMLFVVDVIELVMMKIEKVLVPRETVSKKYVGWDEKKDSLFHPAGWRYSQEILGC